MLDVQADFNKRVAMLGRKHAAMSRGFTTSVLSNGIIVVKIYSEFDVLARHKSDMQSVLGLR